ncbi:MAG TPA: DEAD/DEAH box helicase, partial [Candidatus Angelobacter sp.]|nr:DEAD/DEAH box helicase [Candidatus Angelobacter sp.]
LDARDADELHDGLLTLIALPQPRESGDASSATWHIFFNELVSRGRAARAVEQGRAYWVAAEKARTFAQVFPTTVFESAVADVEISTPTKEDALHAMIAGWMQHSGPVTAGALASLLGLPESDLDNTFLRLETSGAIIRGRFTDPSSSFIEWCDRRLLARIHRLTIGKLRKEIQPVTAAQFMRWLLRWQHLAPGTQLLGERGTVEALRQLQGYEAPANAWERQILAKRIADYNPAILDQLCLTGAVGWGRLSPHPAFLDDSLAGTRRVMPSSIAPITFFVRDDADWMVARHNKSSMGDPASVLSPGAREVLQFLKHRGASFFADIVRGTGKLKSEIESALWEMVAAGIITADGFDNLRALIDPKRRSGHGHGRSSRPRHSSGRWSLLDPDPSAAETDSRGPALEAVCRMLLNRYGVVFREVLTRESILPRWREVLMALRRLEDRGEVRGGRFVSGFLGEQFALPLAVESLRATRSQGATGQTITISATDPLNLVGIIVPGERVPAVSGRFVGFRDGVAVEPVDRSTIVQTFAHAG